MHTVSIPGAPPPAGHYSPGVVHNGFDVFSEANAKAGKVKFKTGASLTAAFILRGLEPRP